VTGFCVFLMGVPVSWKSQAQQSVTLLSSEAEFVALSKVAKEIKFIVQVMLSIRIKVEMPIVVHVDNTGAIFMTENVSMNTHTKHVDICYHYMWEFIEDGFIHIVFVRTKLNKVDMFTKNVVGEIHDAHSKSFTWESSDLK